MQITELLSDIDMGSVKKTGPATATAVAITAGTLLEAIATTRTVQAATDATTGLFYGIAGEDFVASSTEVWGYHDVIVEIASAAAHDFPTTAYAVAGGASVTAASSVGPAVGTFVGPRNATTGKSKVHIKVGMGPALS